MDNEIVERTDADILHDLQKQLSHRRRVTPWRVIGVCGLMGLWTYAYASGWQRLMQQEFAIGLGVLAAVAYYVVSDFFRLRRLVRQWHQRVA